MQPLVINPAIPYVLPPADRVAVALVGCGGTGSHLAQTLAKIAAHCRDSGGPELELFFIDGDRVEQKNVGRQLFSPAEVGRNKAETLAARFNLAFGLRITAVPQMLDGAMPTQGTRARRLILVGAVDSATGRQVMAEQLGRGSCAIWLDCGNHEYGGQVVVGTTTDRKRLTNACALGGICTDLPSPALVYPDLLTAPDPGPHEDCAAAMVNNRQSLLINQMMAAIAGQYLTGLLVERRITTFETVVDLTGMGMRSTPITAQALAAYLPIAEEGPVMVDDDEEEGEIRLDDWDEELEEEEEMYA